MRGLDVLSDLPGALWAELLPAVRRAAGQWNRSELPVGLRPYMGFRPERWASQRPRLAVAQALAADERLRQATGEALDPGLWKAAETLDAGRLKRDHGVEAAAAALAAWGRWDQLAVLAAESVDDLARRERAAAEGSSARRTQVDAEQRRRLTAELAEARTERDAHRRRADAAEQRVRSLTDERERLLATIDSSAAHSAALQERVVLQARAAEREAARWQRRLADAEQRAQVDAQSVLGVAAGLDLMARNLRGALGATVATGTGERGSSAGEQPAPAGPASSAAPPEGPGAVAAVPRETPPATSGRPARLPPGLRPDDPAAVIALLRVPALEVVVDGYNVTKDRLGRPLALLEDQRNWLVRLAAGVVGRFDRRVTLVFDGTEALPGPAWPRGVRVVFSVGEETADERIVTLVSQLNPQQSVLVVTSDRAVQVACAGLGANTAPSGTFLQALAG